jgi:uridylate kinase
MERIAMVIGGSILAPSDLSPDFLGTVADKLREWSKDRQLFVVVGGGSPARRHIEAARATGVSEGDLDRIGIQATRLNAQTLACVLRKRGANANLEIPVTTAQALRLGTQHDVIVMGGTVPGHSTDYVAVELAVEGKCARFVDATNVAGVYTSDPNKHKDAKLKTDLTFEEMLGIIEEREWSTAGAPGVIDGPSTVLIATKGVPTCVVDGRDLDNLGKAVRGEAFRGTRISGKAVKLQGAR